MTRRKALLPEQRNHAGWSLAEARHRDAERRSAEGVEARVRLIRTRNATGGLGLVSVVAWLVAMASPFAFTEVLVTVAGVAGLISFMGVRSINKRIKAEYGEPPYAE